MDDLELEQQDTDCDNQYDSLTKLDFESNHSYTESPGSPDYKPIYAQDRESLQGRHIKSKTIAWCLIDRYNYHHWLRTNSLLVIGRGECDIQLKSRSVDQQHAMLSYDVDVHHYKIKDLDSRHGTFVNEIRIPEDTHVLLDNCDSLRFGYDSTVFRIQKFFTNVDAPRELRMELPNNRDLGELPEWSVHSSISSLPLAECPMCSHEVNPGPKRLLNVCQEHARKSRSSPRVTQLGSEHLENAKKSRSSPKQSVESPQPAKQSRSSPRVSHHSPERLENAKPSRSSPKHSRQDAERPDSDQNVSKKSQVPDSLPKQVKDSKECDKKHKDAEKPKTSLKNKKALELYGQPDWWGQDEEEPVPDSVALNDKKRHSPATKDTTPAEKPMEPSAVVTRQSSKPSEAFTITLDEEDNNSEHGSDLLVKDTLSRFVPSKIRKSFQEREEVKRKKVEELRERTKKSIEKLSSNSKPAKSGVPKQPVKSSGTPVNRSVTKTQSVGKNSSPAPKKEDLKLKKSGVKSGSTVVKPVAKKPSVAPRSEIKTAASSNSKTILFDKLFSSRSDRNHVEHLPEHDMYSEAAGYNRSSPREDEMCSEAGTYTISESDHEDVNEELEDIEFEKLEAFADSLECSTLVGNSDLQALSKLPKKKKKELELKTGPKWMSDVVNGNGSAHYDHSPREAHNGPPRVSKSSSECSPRRSHKSSLSHSSPTQEASEPDSPAALRPDTQRTAAVSDIMSASYPGRRAVAEGTVSSLDTACLLQDTAAVLHDMEERLARHTGSIDNIPFADEENCDLSDGETGDSHVYRQRNHQLYPRGQQRYNQKRASLPVGDIYSEDEAVTARTEDTDQTKSSRSSRSRFSGLRFSNVKNHATPRSNVSLGTRILQRSRDNLIQRFDYGRHSLKMATSNTHPPARHLPPQQQQQQKISPPRASPPRVSSVWTPRGARPLSLHEATLRNCSYSSSSTEDLPSASHRYNHNRLSEFSRDLERLAKKEEFGRRSAFSPHSPTWTDSPGPYRSKSAAHLPASVEEPAAYDTVLAASLLQVASKLRRCSDDLLGRLRRSRHLSRTPSPVEEVFVPPCPDPDSAGSEMQESLHACLYNLQAVQYHLQIIERAIFPQAKSGRNSALGSCSEGDYLIERERINNEIRGFTPIEPAFPATEMKFYTDYKM